MIYNTVVLKDYSHIREEYKAYAAITPGHLVYLKSDGTIAVQADENGNVLPMFALEDALQGNGVDDAYAAGDRVQCWVPTRGDEVNAILKDEETIVVGDFLNSAGNGELKKYDAATSVLDIEKPLAMAITAVDLSSSSAATVNAARIHVRIL